MRIETKRLILRPFEESDYDDLFEFLSQLEKDEFEGYPGITYENGKEHLAYRFGSRIIQDICACLKQIGKTAIRLDIAIRSPAISGKRTASLMTMKLSARVEPSLLPKRL